MVNFNRLAAFLSMMPLTNGSGNEIRRRRLLQDETECVLYVKDIQYDNQKPGNDMWACEFTRSQAEEFGGQEMMLIEGLPVEEIESRSVVSGEAVLKIYGGYVGQSLTSEDMVLIIPEDGSSSVETLSRNDPRHHSQRGSSNSIISSKAASSGTLRTLVVRVTDVNSNGPTADAAQLRNDIFEDAVSMKSQFSACSKGKLNIQPASDVGDGGVVTINVDVAASAGSNSLESAARTKAEELYGGREGLAGQFDLVMFCQPPGSGNWVAYAYINRWDSFYNNDWCQYVSAQLHEVGHNLGLAHSGQGNDQYGDQSSMMGYSYNDDDAPKMCFNAAKNFQLGWFENQQRSVNPLDFVSNPQNFILNGVNDADASSNGGELITLRLEQYGDNNGIDYYIGYNRKAGINMGTKEAGDKVVVFEKQDGGPTEYGKSKRIADLSAGQSMVLPSYKGTNIDVTIKVESITGNMKDANILISAADPNATPTPPPVPAPTPPPTNFPTPQPTPAPVPAPTGDSCGGDLRRQFQLELRTDSYGYETYWYLSKVNPEDTGLEAPSYFGDNYASDTVYVLPSSNEFYCLDLGRCYVLEVYDSYGDGMTYTENAGYRGFLGGEEIFSADGDFEQYNGVVDYQIFCVGDTTPAPTPVPTLPPTRPPTPAPMPVAGPCGDDTKRQLQIELRTDGYGYEIDWYVSRINLDFTALEPASYSGGNYGDNQIYLLPSDNDFYCLDRGRCYVFVINDSYGDGMTYGENPGYRGFLDGTEIFVGDGSFDYYGYQDYHVFCVVDENGVGLLPPSIEPDRPILPSTEPTISPTSGSTWSSTFDCTDDPEFFFKNKKNKNCKKYLKGKKKKKVKKKCKKKWKGKKVYDWCPETCGTKVGLGKCAWLQGK